MTRRLTLSIEDGSFVTLTTALEQYLATATASATRPGAMPEAVEFWKEEEERTRILLRQCRERFAGSIRREAKRNATRPQVSA